MTEIWKGQFTYGNTYPKGIRGTSVDFTTEWTLDDGIIKGVCIDEESKKFLDTHSTINGFVEGITISFIKKYPCLWEEDESGKATIFKHIPSPEIHYSGLFTDGRFEGDWEVEISHKDANGFHDNYILSGTWYLYKHE
jgi:hypothetical protein